MKRLSEFFKIPFVHHAIINLIGLLAVGMILAVFHSINPDMVNIIGILWAIVFFGFVWFAGLPLSAIFSGYLVSIKIRGMILRMAKQERAIRKAIRNRKFVVVTPVGVAATSDILDIVIKQKLEYKALLKSMVEKTKQLQTLITERKKVDNK